MIRQLIARWKNRRELASLAKNLEAENDTLRAVIDRQRKALEHLAHGAKSAASGHEITVLRHRTEGGG
jgi:hypothetical protein